MEIRSKFLNADIEVSKVYRDGERLVVEGLAKGLVPFRIGLDAADAVRIALRSFNCSALGFWARIPGLIVREIMREMRDRGEPDGTTAGAPAPAVVVPAPVVPAPVTPTMPLRGAAGA